MMSNMKRSARLTVRRMEYTGHSEVVAVSQSGTVDAPHPMAQRARSSFPSSNFPGAYHRDNLCGFTMVLSLLPPYRYPILELVVRCEPVSMKTSAATAQHSITLHPRAGAALPQRFQPLPATNASCCQLALHLRTSDSPKSPAKPQARATALGPRAPFLIGR